MIMNILKEVEVYIRYVCLKFQTKNIELMMHKNILVKIVPNTSNENLPFQISI